MAIVADSGGIIGLYDRDDRYHMEICTVFEHEAGQVFLASPFLGELGYMIGEWLGTAALDQFLADLENGVFQLQDFTVADVRRCRQLIAAYADLKLGLADASVIALAERLHIDRILTVDERDFRVVRSAKGKPFTLLPADLAK